MHEAEEEGKLPLVLLVAAERARRSGLVGLPPIGCALAVTCRDLVHRQRIIEVSAEHHAVDFLGMADVLRRIGVENHEVGELAGRSDESRGGKEGVSKFRSRWSTDH